MSYQDQINALAENAEKLESVYQTALKAGEADTFRQAINEHHAKSPENLLYAAWFYRLKEEAAKAKGFVIAWGWVVPLALLNGLLFWWLSDEQRYMIEIVLARRTIDFFPSLVLMAAPLSAVFMLFYLTVVGSKRRGLAALIGVLVIAAGAYVVWVYPQIGTRPFQEQYLTLMVLHLFLLAWAGVGLFLIPDYRDAYNSFTFLIKSLELFIMGGLFVIAGGLFTGITVGLFDALGIEFSTLVQRLFIAGGGGLIPVVATAVIYNPTIPPAEQAFDEGLSKLISLLMRILLPLALLVLLIYLAFIPFNFWEPFNNRDVLIVYNGMLFAVIALLVGATPVSLADISKPFDRWLRRGIIALATLAFIVSLYALSAIVYRTSLDRLTPNRLAFIGSNIINAGLLFRLLYLQVRSDSGQWLYGLFRAYREGAALTVAWTVIMIIALPWLFGIDQAVIDAYPPEIQDIVYEYPDPILLKCSESPHIYLLDRGEKRWIEDIPTFTERGYLWRDVRFVGCDALRQINSGVPIPADAGSPPEP